MKIKHILIVFFLVASGLTSSAQDVATLKMQTMMQKIIMQAPDNFKNLKGAETTRNAQLVAYKANLTKTVTDPAEMKKAVDSNFFGAMLTSNDNIIETGGSTIYVARYDDDMISSVVVKAFSGLPAVLGATYAAKVEELKPVPSPSIHNYVLTIKDVPIGQLDYDDKSGKAQLIIGLKR